MHSKALSGTYSYLIELHGKLFFQTLKIDIVTMIIGLVFIFGFKSEFSLTASNGLMLLTCMVFIALLQSQIIRQNAAGFKFYLKLPINRIKALASFYLAFTLPALIIFTGIVFLIGAIILTGSGEFNNHILVMRYFKVAFIILFTKSLTVNGMIAMKFHFAAIIGYFIILALVASAVMILAELSTMLLAIPSEFFILLFLAMTYLISFIVIKKIEI